MSRRTFFIIIQVMILASPLPFGSVGRVITPLFFIALLIISLLALHLEPAASMPLYWPGIRWLLLALFAFLFLQILPLPWLLLKIISPNTASVLLSLKPAGTPHPGFHSLSLVPMETAFQLFRWLSWAIFFYAVLRLEYSKKEFIKIFHAILASALLQLAIAFLKYVSGNRNFFLFFQRIPENAREPFLTGTIANSDHFAFYLELIFPIAVALFLSELLFVQSGETLARKILFMIDENRKVFYYLAVAVAIGASIILTGSRAGIMTLVISTLVFVQMSIFIRMPTPLRRKFRYVAAGVVVLVVLIGFQETYQKFLSTSTLENARFVYWSNALRLLKLFPLFGCGFGTFKFSYFLRDPMQSGWLTHAHNEYVETLAEGGILGLLLLAALFFLVIFSLFRTWVSRQRPDVKILSLGILISLMGAFLHLAFEFALRIPANIFLLILLAVVGLRVVGYKKGIAHAE